MGRSAGRSALDLDLMSLTKKLVLDKEKSSIVIILLVWSVYSSIKAWVFMMGRSKIPFLDSESFHATVTLYIFKYSATIRKYDVLNTVMSELYDFSHLIYDQYRVRLTLAASPKHTLNAVVGCLIYVAT